MKNDEVRILSKSIFVEVILKGLLLLIVAAFLCVFSFGEQVWPSIFLGIVFIVLLGSILRAVVWSRRVIGGYLLNPPIAMQVVFQVGETVPHGYQGIPDGPTPCYAVLRTKGRKRKVLIHPGIFKTEILRSHDGNAQVYFIRDRQPCAVETRVGVAWVLKECHELGV